VLQRSLVDAEILSQRRLPVGATKGLAGATEKISVQQGAPSGHLVRGDGDPTTFAVGDGHRVPGIFWVLPARGE
jgi:hypothetical protein